MAGQSELNYFSILVEDAFTISFQRTLRIPDDGRDYPLPPSLGAFPIFDSRLYPGTPATWRAAGDLFIPMYRREAMWMGLRSVDEEPRAVLVGMGDVNAVTGKAWTFVLTEVLQNYLVCPPQPWLDGINIGDGKIRQFVAVDSDSGESVEAQLGEACVAGGIRMAIFRPKPGLALKPVRARGMFAGFQTSFATMALGAGGRMQQKIYPDPYGSPTWEPEPACVLRVHIVNSADFQALTGTSPPPTLVTAEEYTKQGLPWFALYDECAGTLEATEEMMRVNPVASGDAAPGHEPDDISFEIPKEQIWKLTL